MLERIYNWLRGYYRLFVAEKDAVALFNTCNKENIFIYDIKSDEDGNVFCLSLKEYPLFHKLSEENGFEVEIKKKSGLLFFLKKWAAEYIFLLGAVFFLIVLLLAANITLEINVKSTEELRYISEAEILSLAADCKIKKWSFIPSIDFDRAEEYIKLHNKYLSFVGIARDGTEILIEVKERTILDSAEQPLPVGNIVAQCDAIIEEIFVLGGTAMVAAGEPVLAGQVLIAGVENGLPAAAEGIIRARVSYEGNSSVALRQEQFELTGERSSSLYLCWEDTAQLIIAGAPTAPYDYFDSKDEKLRLTLGDFELPCFLVKRIYYEQAVRQIELTIEEAQDAAAELAYADALAKLPIIGAEIVSKDLEFGDNESEAEARIKIEVIRSFGVFKPYL